MMKASNLRLESQRSVKCKWCGMRGDAGSGQNLYWWSDEMGGKHLIHGNSSGSYRYGTLHITKCLSTQASSYRDRRNITRSMTFDDLQAFFGGTPDNQPVPEVEKEEAETEVPAPVTAEIDRDELREIVREEVATEVDKRRVTTVEVVTPLETKPLEGVSHRITPTIISALSVGTNVWLSGPAGSGKTSIARQCAQAFDVEFRYVALSFDMPSYKLTGYMDANGKEVRTDAMDAWEHGHLLLLDECDAGNPNTLLVAQAMRDMPMMAFAGRIIPRHPNFKLIAAGNTIGTGADQQYQGRAKLDAAFLNGFVRFHVEYDLALEDAITYGEADRWGVDRETVGRWLTFVRACRGNASAMRLHTVIGPRQSKDGVKLFGAGFTPEAVAEATIFCGMTDADRAKVSEGVTF